MVQGALFCARICPGRLSRRWYANTSGSIGHEGGGGRAAGRFAVSVIAADLQAPNFGSERKPGADLPRKQGPLTAARVDCDTLARVRPRWSVGGRVGGCGAQSEYIKVRSVVDNRAEFARGAAGSGHRPAEPASPYQPNGLACHTGAIEHRREQQASATRSLIVRSSVISRADHCGAGPPGIRRYEPARAATAGGQHHGQRGLNALEVRPPRPSATANSQPPAYAASSQRVGFRLHGPVAVAQDSLSIRLADARPLAVGRGANPQNVRSPRLPSRRDRNQPDTGITNDERGTGTGSHGSCRLM